MEIIIFSKWLLLFFYLISLILYFRFFIKQSEKLQGSLNITILFTIVIHLFYLIQILLYKKHLPLSDVYEVMTSYVFIFVLVYFFIERNIRDYSLGTIILLIAFKLQFVSNFYIDYVKDRAEVLAQLSYFEIHVSIILLAYSAFTISFIASIMYVMLSREIHNKQLGFFFSRLPSLELLDRLSNMAVTIGTSFISGGMLIGIYMAYKVWDQPWVLDPKMISVFITWLIYLFYIYFRNYRGWQGKRASIISICGFVWVILSFIFITIFFSSLHSFT